MTQETPHRPATGYDAGFSPPDDLAFAAPPARSAAATGPSDTSGGVVDTARTEAVEVGRSAADAGGQVASTAADQTKEVVGEVRDQARDLLGEGRAQLREQAVTGQRKAADGLGAVADELRLMADRGDGGLPSELATQGADRLQAFASWLQRREPGDLVEEVRGWARQHPGTFLVGAALAGVVAGRLTSGAIAARRDTPSNGTATDRVEPATAVRYDAAAPVGPPATAVPVTGSPAPGTHDPLQVPR